ncbi:MAG: hypothetical protein P8M22_03260, partial [Phycisphaerales bacterium]|nr:hypothetical protein [Phycisphaerales bacterium]
WVARSIDGNAHVTGPTTSPDDQATLLTTSHVDDWIELSLPEAGNEYQLASMVVQAAENHGLDTAKPFPFIIEGHFSELDLHVIAGSCPIANPNGEQPWRYTTASPTMGLLVGFHAEDQEGVMTHHGSSVHMHALIHREDNTLTAHVDHVIVEPGAILRIPSDS